MSAEFRVGVGKVDITPPLSVPYLGLIPRHAFFTGVHDPLYVRSIVISDGHTEVAIIATDSFGFSNSILGPGRDFTREVRRRVEQETGIPRDAVMLTGSHIHSAPDTLGLRPLTDCPDALPWLERLIGQLAESVSLAREGMFDAVLKVGSGRVDGISLNRRGDDCLDTELTALLFEGVRGPERAVLMNFACHPVTMQVQELVSADYVGVLQESVEGCIFLQGACADIDPPTASSRDFEDARRMGEQLASETGRMVHEMTSPEYPSEPVKVVVSAERLLLPSRPLPGEDEINRIRDEMKELARRAETARSAEEAWGLQESARKCEEVLVRADEGEGPFSAEVQVIRLGNVVIAGIPGEPFCGMGMEIKSGLSPLRVVIAGYSNGYVGYIAPPEAWAKGGYEVACGPWSKVGPEGYEHILRSVFDQV